MRKNPNDQERCGWSSAIFIKFLYKNEERLFTSYNVKDLFKTKCNILRSFTRRSIVIKP